MRRLALVTGVVLMLLTLSRSVLAQGTGLAATMEVLSSGVEVLRVGTSNWIAVAVESILGTGDSIRTDATGTARITFFADGTAAELLPESEYRIVEFQGDDATFTISLEVIAGQTIQTIGRVLETGSQFDVQTPAMTLSARGTIFRVRVEPNGRSAVLVREGVVAASTDEGTVAEVPVEFGLRTAVNASIGELVRASTFEELDAALDGCVASVSNPDDVSFNVRISPSPDAEIVGMLDIADIDRFFGVTENGEWHRVAFRGGYGWLRATMVTVDAACAGLRLFPNDYGPEDASLYSDDTARLPAFPLAYQDTFLYALKPGRTGR
ncbi:MAG: FecR domain-containing protein [Chloroflexota bacterium]|nr:FecR domain-containing protein [Chloroflexota bacterium]